MSVYDINGTPIQEAPNAVAFGCDNTASQDASVKIQQFLNAYNYCYFPAGTYNIEKIVYIPSGVTIACENGTVFKRAANINAMFTSAGDTSITEYNGVHDVKISGATFDASGSEYSYSCTMLSFCHARRIHVEGCKFMNPSASWHCIELTANEYSKIQDCFFDFAGNTSEAIQIESPYNQSAWPWSNGAIDNTPSQYNEVSGCTFLSDGSGKGVGNHLGGISNYANIHDCVFIDCTHAVSFGNGTGNLLHDCSAVDVAYLGGGSTTKAYNNNLNGTFTP